MSKNHYFIKRKAWPKGDPRRTAAFKALIWRIFFSPTTVATTGGLLAVLSVVTLVWQNGLLESQNTLIAEQNQFFQTQINQQATQYDLQRRTELIAILYGDDANARTRSEAVVEFIQLERKRLSTGKTAHIGTASDQVLKEVNLAESNLTGVMLEGQDLSHVNFSGADFTGADLQGAKFHDSGLDEANFKDALLNGAEFQEAFTMGMNIEGASITLTHGLEGADICEMRGVPKSLHWNLAQHVEIHCPERLPNPNETNKPE